MDPNVPHLIDLDRVDLDRVVESEITDRYVGPRVPFVGYSRAAKVTALQGFLQENNERSFRVSRETFQLPKASERVALREFFRRLDEHAYERGPDREPCPYVFHDLLGGDYLDFPSGMSREAWEPGALETLEEDYPPPDFFMKLSQEFPAVAIRLAFGPAASHSGLHSHGDSICRLLCGRKEWVLHPPVVWPRLLKLIAALRMKSPQLFWIERVLPLARDRGERDVVSELAVLFQELIDRGVCERAVIDVLQEPLPAKDLLGLHCTQQPGETVYVPTHWGLYTLNAEWTLALIYELRSRPI